MQNNAKVGGILSIISGAIGVMWLIGTVFSILMMSLFVTDTSFYYGDHYHGYPSSPDEALLIMIIVSAIMGGFFTLVGVLGIIGGAFAVRRKNWGLALAGSIAAALVFFPCGIPAIIFTVMGKPEFEGQDAPA
ncbi:MAG: hypothetical protein JXA51_00325 [Dehalococcoidales bacterium]|nr:hypothetical protein [Dehalococcoidales bacterium]